MTSSTIAVTRGSHRFRNNCSGLSIATRRTNSSPRCSTSPIGLSVPIGNGQSLPRRMRSGPKVEMARSTTAGSWARQSTYSRRTAVTRRFDQRVGPGSAGVDSALPASHDGGECPSAVDQHHLHGGEALQDAAEHEMCGGNCGLRGIAQQIREVEVIEANVGARARVQQQQGTVEVESFPQRLQAWIRGQDRRPTRRRGRADKAAVRADALVLGECHLGVLEGEVGEGSKAGTVTYCFCETFVDGRCPLGSGGWVEVLTVERGVARRRRPGRGQPGRGRPRGPLGRRAGAGPLGVPRRRGHGRVAARPR